MRPTSKPGFTIIELMVVLAIIITLAAIMIPVIGSTLEKGRRAGCRSNLKQLGAAMINFAADNNGWLPLKEGSNYRNPYGAGGTLGGQYPLTGVVREMYNKGFMTDLSMWVCPSDEGEGNRNRHTREMTIQQDVLKFDSYGNASYMYVAGMNDKIYIRSVAEAAVLTDESWQRERGDRTPGRMPEIEAIDNHGASMRNVLYYDGHVVTIEGAGVANAVIFPEGTNAWTDYAKVNSID